MPSGSMIDRRSFEKSKPSATVLLSARDIVLPVPWLSEEETLADFAGGLDHSNITGQMRRDDGQLPRHNPHRTLAKKHGSVVQDFIRVVWPIEYQVQLAEVPLNNSLNRRAIRLGP